MIIPALSCHMVFDGVELDVSELVRAYVPVDRAMSEDFGHAISSRSMTLRYNAGLVSRITSAVQILVIIDLDGVRDFSGKLVPSASIASLGASLSSEPDVDDIAIEVDDLSSILDYKITDADTVALQNGKVCDPANPSTSIVHYLLNLAGAACAITETIDVTLLGFAVESGTVADTLNTLLGEYGYAWRMDEYGRVVLTRWLYTNPVPTVVLNEDNITGTLEAERLAIESDAVKVSWTALKERTGALVYLADLPFGDDNRRSGWPIQPGYLYPEEANTADAWWTYDDVALANRKDERGSVVKETDFTSIVLTKNHSIEEKLAAGITREFTVFQNKRARIGYRCTVAESRLIYYCRILADVVYRGAKIIECANLVSNPKSAEEYDALYIHDAVHAQAFCSARAGRLRDAAWRYTCRSEIIFPLGAIVTVSDPYSGITAIAIIIERERDLETGIHRYKAVGISGAAVALIPGATVILPAPPTAASNPIIQLENVPTFEELSQGFEGNGGTLVPTAPTLLAQCLFQTAYLVWNRQPGLTGSVTHRLYISDSTDGPWLFEAEVAGFEYQDAGLALGGTAAAPTARTYYYRVSRVVNGLIEGPASAVAMVTADAIPESALKAGSVTAGKLKAGETFTATIQSLNYDAANYLGWRIDAAGNAKFYGSIHVGDAINYLDYAAGVLTLRLTSFRVSTLQTRMMGTLQISDLGDIDAGLTKPLTISANGTGSAFIGVDGVPNVISIASQLVTINGGLQAQQGLFVAADQRVGSPAYDLNGYKTWESYAFDSTGGGAAIVNDNSSYKALMILGNRSAGGSRIIKMWDNVTVMGTCAATTFQGGSALILKRDISPFTDSALGIFRNVKIVNYLYKTSDDPHVGFIADYTNPILSGPKQDSISIQDCIGVLIKAVQELDYRTKL